MFANTFKDTIIKLADYMQPNADPFMFGNEANRTTEVNRMQATEYRDDQQSMRSGNYLSPGKKSSRRVDAPNIGDAPVRVEQAYSRSFRRVSGA